MRAVTSAIVVASFAVVASAQPVITASTVWEVSLDNGASWQGGVVNAPTSQASALVRLRVGWTVTNPPPGSMFYHSMLVDSVAQSLGAGGLGDTITNPMELATGSSGTSLVVSSSVGKRIGSLLKLDPGWPNLSLPAADAQWMNPRNLLLGIPGFFPTFDNPVTVIQYQLNLDGTQGARELYGVFFRPEQALAFRVYNPGFPDAGTFTAPLQQFPATLIVPAPGVGVLALGALAFAARRRRSTR